MTAPAEAQSPLRPAVDPPPPSGSPPWIVRAGPEYEAGGLRRALLGDGYRDLWTTRLQAPVLDLRKEAHGLVPIRAGGGFQTQTIHLRGGDDGYYLFRSVNKAVRAGLDDDLRDTPAGWLVQEATSAFHPGANWIVPPLLEAVGVPQSRPKLFVMPDDPALGEHREAFAGVLGMLVESPDKGESGEKRFRGSDDIASSEDMLLRLAANPAERVDARGLLASRLVDLIVGDPDRNYGNFRWIAFDSAGTRTWRAVPMDRDPAFLHADGLVNWIVREAFISKLVRFGPEYEDVAGLWASQPEVDRLLLAELDRNAWDDVVARVRTGLTDEVIRDAVGSQPPEFAALGGAYLEDALRRRRDALPEVAARFYEALAEVVDVQGTAAAEVAEVVHRADGSVEVALHAECPSPTTASVCGRTHFRRVFDPEDTEEVRIYLREGNDGALVRGDGPQRIRVRVIGGPGDDRMEDASRPQGDSRTSFYDHEGENDLLAGPDTRVVRKAWTGRTITDFVAEDKSSTYRDYGDSRTWTPVLDLDGSAGLILGVRRREVEYGFRREPWAEQLDLTGLVSTGGGFGGEAALRRRREGSDVVLFGEAGFGRDVWSYRFYGLGNETPLVEGDAARVPSDDVRLEAGVELPVAEGARLSLGPAFRWLWPEPAPGGPLDESGLPGATDFGQAGVAAELEMTRVDDEVFPRRGFDLRAGASAWAPLTRGADPFGRGEGEARAYLPFLLGSALAVRVGGGIGWGTLPAHESVFLGGRRSLRGFRTNRFAGDAALYGGAELRLPLGRVTLLTRGQVGAIAFADAGRVYVDGASPGGWHTSWGAGYWYSTMGVTGALLYGVGEENRVHIYFGLPF